MKTTLNMGMNDVVRHIEQNTSGKVFKTLYTHFAELEIVFPEPNTVKIDLEQHGDITDVYIQDDIQHEMVKKTMNDLKSAINSPVSEENGNSDQQAIQEENLPQEPFWKFPCSNEKLIMEIHKKTNFAIKNYFREGNDINLAMDFNSPTKSATVIVTASRVDKGCVATVKVCGNMRMASICKDDMDILMNRLQKNMSQEQY